MKLSNLGLDLLIEREGVRNEAYLDTRGIWTIGIGHTGYDVAPGMVWDDEKVRSTFARDVGRFEMAVGSAVKVPISQNEFDALVSFAYNIGEMGMLNSWVVRELNRGFRGAAAAMFNNWHLPPEIIPRRNGEREQFRGTRFEARIP